MAYDLDTHDKSILRILQQDATISMDDLSDRVSLSRNACWRRVKQMETAGIITARVAVVDPQAVGLSLTAIVLIKTDRHDTDWSNSFTTAVRSLPEIQSAHRMSGDLDYVLKVRLTDIKDYDRFYQRLISKVAISEISASFVMDDIRDTNQLPIL